MEFLKNWRPISLLNVDYKLLLGAMANRIKKVLPSIINQEQKGFLKKGKKREGHTLQMPIWMK